MLKFWLLILIPCFHLQAQTGTCSLKEPGTNINFGAGEIAESSIGVSYTYRRVASPCPSDGHYAIVPYTSDCFRGDWITLEQDHTPGDREGNMLVVNSSYGSGVFFNSSVGPLKPGAHFEFSVWMLNLCKPTEKCPYPLLPNISILVTTAEGRQVLELNTGDLKRNRQPNWTKYAAMFKTPKSGGKLNIVMINHSPGGCGNDFAMDDISFKECIITPPPITKKPTPVPLKKITAPKGSYTTSAPPKKAPKPVNDAKKTTVAKPKPVEPSANARKPESAGVTVIKPKTVFPPPPAPVATRSNPVVKRFETQPGVISIRLFDNGQIDGDTVSIYHNNKLILSRVRLSEKPISFSIAIDANNPHHELVMVANNLGSIPPNTSLMYVIAGGIKHEVFISSTEKQNAKIVFDLAH